MRIVGLAPNTWRGQWLNRQQLLSRLALKHRVVYSTGAWSVWDRHQPEWRRAPLLGSFRKLDNVLVDDAPKFMLRWPKVRAYDECIVRLQARRLAAANRDESPSLTLIFHPMLFPYARHLKSDFLAFHAYDLFEGTPGWTTEDDTLERALLEQADLVTAVSEGIAERLREKVARAVEVLPNGVDLQGFETACAAAAVPAELARIPRPRLGYIGSLHPQIDYALVTMLARSRPDWHFVFVGDIVEIEDARARRDLGTCRKCANVHFLGGKNRHIVPAFAVNMDVNLMLYRLDDQTWIKGIYPLKLHEYLASGKPVVSADVPAVREFRDVVRIASGVDDWLAAIQDGIESGGQSTPAQRRAVAAANTWDARASRLDSLIGALTRVPAGRMGPTTTTRAPTHQSAP
jgi:glycosyltransferase involved in cell wall biosynthesis